VRQLLTVLIPLLLPMAGYLAYLSMMRRYRQEAGGAAAGLGDVPWVWLIVAGALLVAVTFVAYALFGGAEPGSVYTPARVIDGKIDPGGFSQ
jgi:hypothetical protein